MDVQEAPGDPADQEHLVHHQFPEDHEDQIFLSGLSLLLVLVILEVLLGLDDHVCLLQQALILVLLFVPFFLYQNWYCHLQLSVDKRDSIPQGE